MDKILVRRVELRKEALASTIASIKPDFENGEMIIEQAIIGIKKLKDLVERLSSEINEYTTKIQDPKIEAIEPALKMQIETEQLVSTMEATVNSITTNLTQKSESQCATRLPKLELPQFNGDRLRWMEFWDRFRTSIHERQVSEADKLVYLLSCLEGEAMEAVSGLPTTNANYTVAIEALQRRFGSNDSLIDAHYTQLCNLQKAGPDARSCRATLDEIERHLRVLEKLGEPANGNHFRALVLRKFPDKIVHEHHLISGGDNSMLAIRHSLHRIITAMESSTAVLGTPALIPVAGPSTATTEALHIRTETPVGKGQPRKNSNRKRKFATTRLETPTKKPRRPCLFCEMTNHSSVDCKKFNTVEARKRKLEGRCLKCLLRNHKTEDCRRKVNCFRCKGDHFQLLCPEFKGKEGQNPVLNVVKTKCNLTQGLTFLQTAVAETLNPEKSNKIKKSRILLDSGSQRSYISKKLAENLQLSIKKEDMLLIYTFGASSPSETSSPSTEVIVQTKRGISRKLQVNIVPHITDRVPVTKFDCNDIDVFADDSSTGDGIDLLIGNDFYCSFIRNNNIRLAENLFLMDTDFGYVCSGNTILEGDGEVLSVTTYCQCHTPNCPYFTEPDLPLRNIDIKFLWSLESIGITDSPKATRQEEAVHQFNNTVKYQNGRYEVKWPWIQYPPNLPSNFGLALGRLRSLLRRIDSESLKEYADILKEQLELGIIEVIDPVSNSEDNTTGPVHYLPHHIVRQEGKKGRLVYDASAKTAGDKSLNECLYSGPYMLEDLTALLLKFRTKKIGITADVEKAFLQIGLHNEDRDVTRFLWVKDTSKEPTGDNVMHLRFCRVPFGVISSPFLLTATIKHHMTQSNDEMTRAIADKCYVDNLVTGADSTQEAVDIYQKTRTAFNQLSMNIRDWTSNDEDFVSTIPVEQRAKQTNEIKILGLSWDLEKDELKLKVTEDNFNPKSPVNTKRKVLRALARIFDPNGFVCPLILPLKLLFQDICEKKFKWDAALPQEMTQPVTAMLDKLKIATKSGIPRYIGMKSSDPDSMYELHGFSDASKNAYAAVVYLRSTGPEESSISFLMGKCHVARSEDKKELKIPKLELLGVLITSRLLKYIKSNIDLPIRKEFLWTDSLVVLGWLRSNKLLPPFVTNRVEEIKRNLPHAELYHISTKLNPADLATRPETWEEKRNLWYNGPEFLKCDETYWPKSRHHDSYKTFFSVGEALDPSPEETQMDLEDSDHLTHNPMQMEFQLQEPDEIIVGVQSDMSVQGTANSIPVVIKKLQAKYYPNEVSGKITHLTRNINLFMDVDGLLRCRGRMANAICSYDMKCPILLPRDCDLTNSIIKETHESNYHVGAAHTLSIIRRQYWIPQGKSQVQKVIRRCPECIKHGGGPYQLPPTPSLPPERANYSTAFTFTGLDYFGPLYVNSPYGKVKRWVALFTCLAVRAIHLEIVQDLTADECLLALRRFVATRNSPIRVYSDNATYFKLTSEVMGKPYCIERGIQWKFIPQLAPWHGGFYERLVALVKHCLKRTLEKHLLSDSKLHTAMKEVEAIVNSRPLTQVGTEVEHILTPSDFLTLGKCLTLTPTNVETPCVGTASKQELIESWKRGLKILEEFKKMFQEQYLACLRERYRHSPKQPRIKSSRIPNIGDFVQIKSDSKNRNNWKVGKVVDLIKGADEECRVAKVKVEDTILTRSIGHLYPLEIGREDNENKEKSQTDEDLHTSELPDQTTIQEIPVPNPDVNYLTGKIDDAGDNQEQCHKSPSHNPIPMDISEVSMEEIHPQEITEGNLDTDPRVEPDDSLEDNNDYVESGTEQQRSVTEASGRRDAAVRAREKIREWTRHLLALFL